MKRLIPIIIGVVITAFSAGCGNSDQGAGNSVDNSDVAPKGSEEKQEISLAYWDIESAFVGDDVLSEIENKLNIELKPVNISWDDYQQKIQLWATSESLPDLFAGDFRTDKVFQQWSTQGIVKEIPKDLTKYPNLNEYMSDEAIVESAKIDGSIYCIPRKSYGSQEWTAIDRLIAYRWDLAQDAGITAEPTTWAEFDNMIQQIIKADPEQTGIQGMTASTSELISTLFLPYSSTIACDNKWIKNESGVYVPAYFGEDLTGSFKLMRGMYENGTIEKDVALTNNQSSDEKFLQGKSAAMLIAGGAGANNYETVARYWEEVHGVDYLEDVKFLNLMPDEDGNLAYPATSYAWSESFINNSVDDVKLDKILELYDYLLSEEGSLYSTYGPEDDLYNLVENKVVLKEGADVEGTYPSTSVLSNLVRWSPATYEDRFAVNFPEEYKEINKSIVEQAKTVEIPEYYPECEEKAKVLGIDLGIKREDDIINIMTGVEPVEKMWNDIYKKYEADGLQSKIDEVNAAMGN
ncbi:MAG: extracellular solute-binding protein [Lachnospirales bacterium]